MSRILLVCVTLLSPAIALADTPTSTIPLDEIWGYNLPGTRDVRDLEPKLDIRDPNHERLFLRSAVNQIARFLATYVPNEGEMAGSGFVVVGTGKEALNNAREVFSHRNLQPVERPLPRDTQLSLIFYSYTTGWHPQIKSVQQSPEKITIRYQFVAPKEPALGAKSLAIIPIGKLSEGTVEVNIEQTPPKDFAGRPVPPKLDAERFVCASFSFDVQ